MLAPWTRIWRGKWAKEERRRRGVGSKMHSSTLQAIGLEVKCTEREKGWGVGGKKQATHSQSKKSCPSCTIHFKSLRTHRFRIQLVSVLCQNLFHTGLFCVCYKAEPSVKRGGEKAHASDKIRMQTHDSSHGKAWKSMRHPVIGRRSAHASFLPRPLGNGIPHHHALLHLAEFAEVLLQALCKDTGETLLKGKGMREGLLSKQGPGVLCSGWSETMGVGRTTLCLCACVLPRFIHRALFGHSAQPAPLGPADHKQSYTLGDARCFDTAEAAAVEIITRAVATRLNCARASACAHGSSNKWMNWAECYQ